MQRNFLTILLTGVLAAACAQPEPPPPGVANPDPAAATPAASGSYITTTMGKDPSPPGTPSYVISPGEPNRGPASGRPRVGGDPTF